MARALQSTRSRTVSYKGVSHGRTGRHRGAPTVREADAPVTPPRRAVGSLWVSVGHAAGDRAVVDVVEARWAAYGSPRPIAVSLLYARPRVLPPTPPPISGGEP